MSGPEPENPNRTTAQRDLGQPTQWAYDQACKALWKHRAEIERLREALAELVKLKDGLRDAEYKRRKPEAWARARALLALPSRTEER